MKKRFRRGQYDYRPDEVLRPVAQHVIFRSMIYLGVRLGEPRTLLEVASHQHIQKWRQGQAVPCSKYLLELIGHIIDEGRRRERAAAARLKALKELTCRDCRRKHRAWEYEQLALEAQAIEDKQDEMLEAVQRLT